MAKRTIRDRLLKALVEQGSGLIDASKKHWKVSDPKDPNKFYFLGPSGALHYGTSQTGSYSLTAGKRYKALLASGFKDT